MKIHPFFVGILCFVLFSFQLSQAFASFTFEQQESTICKPHALRELQKVLEQNNLSTLIISFAPSFQDIHWNLKHLEETEDGVKFQYSIQILSDRATTEAPQQSVQQSSWGSFFSAVSSGIKSTVSLAMNPSATAEALLQSLYKIDLPLRGHATVNNISCPAPYLPEGKQVAIKFSDSDLRVKSFIQGLNFNVCYSIQETTATPDQVQIVQTVSTLDLLPGWSLSVLPASFHESIQAIGDQLLEDWVEALEK